MIGTDQIGRGKTRDASRPARNKRSHKNLVLSPKVTPRRRRTDAPMAAKIDPGHSARKLVLRRNFDSHRLRNRMVEPRAGNTSRTAVTMAQIVISGRVRKFV